MVMAKPWAEVFANPAYQALSEADKAQAKVAYFNEVVRPKLSEADLPEARAEFFQYANSLELPKPDGLYEGFVKPTVKAIPKVVGATAGSLAAMPVAGLAGLAKTITSGVDEGGKTYEAVASIPIQLLDTPEEQQGMANISLAMKPFQMAGEGWGQIGRAITEGAPNALPLEPILGTMGEAAAMFGLPAGAGKVKARTLADIKSLDQLRDLLVEAKQPTVPVTRNPMGPDAPSSPWNPQLAEQLRAARSAPPALPPGQGFTMPEGTPYLPEVSKAIQMGYEEPPRATWSGNLTIPFEQPEMDLSGIPRETPVIVSSPPEATGDFSLKARTPLSIKSAEDLKSAFVNGDIAYLRPISKIPLFFKDFTDPQKALTVLDAAGMEKFKVMKNKVEVADSSGNKHNFIFTGDPITGEGIGYIGNETFRRSGIGEGRKKIRLLSKIDKGFAENPSFTLTDDMMLEYRKGNNFIKLFPDVVSNNLTKHLENMNAKPGDVVHISEGFLENKSPEIYLTRGNAGGNTLYSNPFGAAVKWVGEKLYEPAIRIGDMLFNPNRTLEKVDTPETRGHEFQRKAIDRSIAIKDFEQGKNVSPQESPYLLNERTRSMVGAALEEVEKMKAAWTAEAVKATKPFGESLSNISDYIYAKFALQRNKTVEARRAELIANGENPGDYGSGMSDAEANAIIQNVAASGKTALYDKVAAPIWDMGRKMRELLLKEGMIDAETAAAWESDGGPFYVTLQGGINKTSPMYSQGTAARAGTGIKSYVGRMSKADDPVVNMFRQYKNIIQRVHENRVRQSVLDLVEKNPDPSIAVNEWQSRMKYDPETGQVTPVTEPPWMSTNQAIRENTVPVMKDGKHYYMTFADNPLLARALKGTPDQMGKAMQYLASGVRVLSALKTKYAPDFLVTNPIRDYLDSLHAVTVEDSMSLAKDTGRDVFKGMGATWRQARGKFDPANEWDVYAQEFRQNGGRTGYYALRDFETEAAHINSLAARHQGGAKGDLLKAWDRATQFMEDFGSMTENGIRQSLYTNMRKRGFSVEESIHAAKNVTINFDKQGEWGPRMKALYMFVNPSIQGSKRFVELMTHPSKKGAAIAASAFSAALALNEINRWIAGEDENGINKWDRVSITDKTRNLIVMRPGSDQPLVKIPLGFYQRLFFGAAASIDEAVRNPMKSAGGGAADLVEATIDAFNPLGGGNIKTAFIPSAVRPIAEAAINETWAGTPIHPELMPNEYKAKSEKYFESATELGKGTANWLNRITGGDEVESGKISVSPNTIDYLANFYLGDPAVSLGRLVDTAAKYYQGKEVTSQKIPMVRRFTGANTEYAYTKWKQEAAKEAGTQYARDKLYLEKQGEDPSEYELSPIGELGRETPSFNKEYAELKKLMKDLYSDQTKDWTRAEKLTVQKQLKDEMEAMLKSYVGAYLRQRQMQQAASQQQVY